ncbi:hypothetical protein [Gloeocapsopsis crepidinum]|nr:hypothetical protein [Gloeocapsopsis crepidinum]
MKSLNVSPSLRLQPAAQHHAATDGMKILVMMQKLSTAVELHRY